MFYYYFLFIIIMFYRAESAEMEKKLSNRTFPVIGLNKFGIVSAVTDSD